MLNTKSRTPWVASAVLFLSGAFGAKAAIGADTRPRDLTYAEAKALIPSFGATVSNESRDTATLTGFLHPDCQKSEMIGFQAFGPNFRIHLKKGFEAFKHCVETHPVDKEEPSHRLSTLDSTKIYALGSLTGEVRFAWTDQSVDPSEDRFASFSPVIKLGDETSKAQAAEKSDQERARELKELISKIRSCPDCRTSEQNIENALAGIEELLDSGKLDEDDAEDYRKTIGNAEFDRLEKKLAKLSGDDVNALEDLDRAVTSWMNRYDEFEKSKGAGTGLRLAIAKKLAEDLDRTARGLRSAQEIFNEVAESDDASAAQRHGAELGADTARKELVKSELAEHVDSELASGATPAAIQQSLMEHGALRDYSSDLEADMQSACGTAGGRSFQRCAELRQRATAQQSEMQALIFQQISMAQVQYQQQQMEMMRQQQEAQMRSFQNYGNPNGGFYGYPMPGRF